MRPVRACDTLILMLHLGTKHVAHFCHTRVMCNLRGVEPFKIREHMLRDYKERIMDPSMLVLFALTTGAGAHTRFNAITADTSKKLYNELKAQLQHRFTERHQPASLLASWDDNYETLRLPLKEALEQAHLDEDEEVVETARKLLDWLRPLQPLLNGYTYRMTGNIQDQIQGEYQSIITE
jgi:hypothetical protein